VTKPRKATAAARPVLKVPGKPGESHERVMARANLRPSVQAALTLRAAIGGAPEDQLDLTALVEELADQSVTVRNGNLARAEAMLVAQAHTLDALFHRLARQAIPNIGHYPDTVAVYMKLALKAQAQARATVETLNEMKHPRPVAFVAQANVGQNVQVNNGTGATVARGETENEQTGLLGASDGERMDAGTAGAAGRGDQALATVDPINRAEDR
jgi:hypothetical protein